MLVATLPFPGFSRSHREVWETAGLPARSAATAVAALAPGHRDSGSVEIRSFSCSIG